MRDRARWTPQYHQRVLATDPIAYWVLDEKQGGIAYDLVSGRVTGAKNGAHVGGLGGQGGIGDGRTSRLYDGIQDYTNVYSTALAAAFNGAEGMLLAWGQVANAGVWTDGARRAEVWLAVDGNNFVRMLKETTNVLGFTYKAGGTLSQPAGLAVTPTTFFAAAITWSKVMDQVKAYYQGVQTGATINGLGVWAGSLSAMTSLIGAAATVPGNVWSGTLYGVALWDNAKSADVVKDLSRP